MSTQSLSGISSEARYVVEERHYAKPSFDCGFDTPFGLLNLRSGTVFLFLMGILLLSSCTLPSDAPETPADFVLVTDATSSVPSPTAFLPQTPTSISATETAIPLPTQTSPNPPVRNGKTRPEYVIKAILNYPAHTLDVEQTIRYTNQSNTALDALVLAVDPNRWGDCFELQSLSLNGFSISPQLEGMRMEIPFGAKLQPGESVTLEMAYRLNIPPKQNDQVFGYLSDFQINLVNWYPFIVPYDDTEGWLIHSPSGLGEHLVYETSDFDVTLKIEGGEDVVVAASAAGKQTGVWYQYQLEGARTFAFSISSAFSSETVSSENGSVTSFYFLDYDKPGKAILNAASRAIDIYSRRYAPNPYEHLSIVQTHLPDGMEYDGLIFMGSEFYDEYDGTLKNNLIALGVHEVSHQWFFGLVGSDQALEPWLDESLALYSERVFYEETPPYPITWWWRWRVTWFQPSGWVNATIYDSTDFRGYTDAAYLQGALFLEELRTRIGEKAFTTILQDYAASYTHQITTTDDFFDIVDRHTDQDYSDIVDAYFLNR